jgi:hypothetical protein
MNMLKAAARTIDEDATGATGVDHTDRGARIASAASALVDYVYEYLLDDDITYGTEIDVGVYRIMETMVACAMLAQYEYDQGNCNNLIEAITDKFCNTPEITAPTT